MRVALLVTIGALATPACGDGETPYLLERAEEVRELDARGQISVVRLSTAEYAVQASERVDRLDEQELEQLVETYGRLGFFGRDIDLRAVLAGSSSDWVGGQYSPETKQITLVGEATAAVVLHEYVHALQDQHFDLGAGPPSTSDAMLARCAVVEGDAVLAETRFLAQEQAGLDLDVVQWRQQFDLWRSLSRSFVENSGYPAIFVAYPSFCYARGLEFTAHNLLGASYDRPAEVLPAPHDWRREDALFMAEAPQSTQQVLRLDPALEPVAVGLADVPSALADRLETVENDVLGAWYLRLLLYEAHRDYNRAALQAAAWRGDQVLFVVDQSSKAYGFVWVSAWADQAAASDILATMAGLYGQAPVQDGPPELAVAGDGELTWIEQRGDRAAVAKNLAQELVQALVDAAFAAGPATKARRTEQPLLLRLAEQRLHARAGELPR
jgi:hypothetical protein